MPTRALCGAAGCAYGLCSSALRHRGARDAGVSTCVAWYVVLEGAVARRRGVTDRRRQAAAVVPSGWFTLDLTRSRLCTESIVSREGLLVLSSYCGWA